VSVYEQRGQMQLVAETMEPVGAGSLQLAFEQLKDGLKRKASSMPTASGRCPHFPRRGIVTSRQARDSRFPQYRRAPHRLSVLLFPVSVQGDQAPVEVEAAIAALNASGLVDVIVLARGGGSLEDLAAFNSERVARAIAASNLPVVSAIGHETDSPSPTSPPTARSHAFSRRRAHHEAQHKIAERLANQAHRLERAASFQFLQARQRLTVCP